MRLWLATFFAALAFTAVSLPVAGMACGPKEAPERTAEPAKQGDRQAVVKIAGMTCGGCANGIALKLEAVEGVRTASVDFTSERATIVYDPAKVTADDLIKAVADQGYTATKVEDRSV